MRWMIFAIIAEPPQCIETDAAWPSRLMAVSLWRKSVSASPETMARGERIRSGLPETQRAGTAGSAEIGGNALHRERAKGGGLRAPTMSWRVALVISAPPMRSSSRGAPRVYKTRSVSGGARSTRTCMQILARYLPPPCAGSSLSGHECPARAAGKGPFRARSATGTSVRLSSRRRRQTARAWFRRR